MLRFSQPNCDVRDHPESTTSSRTSAMFCPALIIDWGDLVSNPIKDRHRIPVRLRLAPVVATLVVASAGLGSAASAAGPTVVRFQGVDRFATSAAIVQASYQPGVPVVYIATGVKFPDALAGGAAAANAGGPLLLVLPNSIPTQIAAELTRLTPASIVVLGGTGAVSDGVMASLKSYSSGPVTRVPGADRYSTAASLAGSFPAGSPVFVATGQAFPDALAGTAAAAARHGAILLTGPNTLPPATAAALSKLAPSSITILGGTGAVSAAVATQLGTYSSNVARLSGPDRYATAAAIATSAFPAATGVFITTGAGFADGLTGGPVAGAAGQPLLLATSTCLPATTAAIVTADAPATATLLGGTTALGDGVASLTSCPVVPAPVSAGGGHTCALTSAGGVQCWGANTSGQLGNGTTTASNVPVDVQGLSVGVVDVSAGVGQTCAVTTAGAVKCWGANFLGDGTTTASSVPVDVIGLGSGVVRVSTGLQVTCAVTSAGAVKCWGANAHGELGIGTTSAYSLVPVGVVGLGSGVAAVSVGGFDSCALTTAGAVRCWGLNESGGLGNGTTTASSVPVGVVGLGSGVAAVSVGFDVACAVTSGGALKCWGDNAYGRLGQGTSTIGSSVPVGVVGLGSGVAAVSVAGISSCALTTVGAVKCWGDNSKGQLGAGSISGLSSTVITEEGNSSTVPVEVVGLASGVVAVSTSGFHACAVTSAGQVKCWGDNSSGGLGDGTITSSSVPVDVVGLG